MAVGLRIRLKPGRFHLPCTHLGFPLASGFIKQDCWMLKFGTTITWYLLNENFHLEVETKVTF